VELECDRTWVEVALGNLLENALKFTPPGGRIELGGDGTGQEVKVWVQDSGPGVAAADRPLIFQRFFRGRNAAGSGSGLGLAIAQSVMHAHDGSVALEDGDHNEGARFTLVFPR
jgi:signal transduction histidine kinase